MPPITWGPHPTAPSTTPSRGRPVPFPSGLLALAPPFRTPSLFPNIVVGSRHPHPGGPRPSTPGVLYRLTPSAGWGRGSPLTLLCRFPSLPGSPAPPLSLRRSRPAQAHIHPHTILCGVDTQYKHGGWEGRLISSSHPSRPALASEPSFTLHP